MIPEKSILVLTAACAFLTAACSSTSAPPPEETQTKAVVEIQKAAVKQALPVGWTFYLPGSKNATDPKIDIEAQGFKTFSGFDKHFSFVTDSSSNGKVLKINTTDGKNDVVLLPLDGSEKRLTVIFKAKGAIVPDRAPTPFGLFWMAWQRGRYQAVLRHNASNQVKGSTGQTSMKPENIVDGWRDYRFVFEVADDDKTMTATAFINGVQRHQTKNYVKDSGEEDFSPEKLNGSGNFFLFGENDGSTNGFARYPYILIIKDEDVSTKSLQELSKQVGFDLSAEPVTIDDPDPVSKKPELKPAGINMTAMEASSKNSSYIDPSYIKDGKIDFDRLPYSKNVAQKIVRNPGRPRIASPDAVVDPTGASGAYKTIAAAIEAVEPGSGILVKPGLYYEKLKITKPNLSLIGEDPATTIIFGYEADMGGIDGNLLVEVNLPGAGGAFCAENITFYNKGAEWNITWDNVERRSIALALKNVQGGYLRNCVFLGQQDTMYLRSGRIAFERCYIEGEVDFICGGATVLFDNCHIHSIFYKNGGYITAAAPADSGGKGFENGYVFRDCLFTADQAMTAKNIYFGRGAWTGGSNGQPNPAKVVIMNSEIGGYINAAGWADWDNVSTAAKQFFREYDNTGAGAIRTETATRKFLTKAEYESAYSNAERILGFVPLMPYER